MSLSKDTLLKYLPEWLDHKLSMYIKLNTEKGYSVNPEEDKEFLFLQTGDTPSNVLFVSHIDTVLPPRYNKHDKKKDRIYAQGLDDRLGCFLGNYLSKVLRADHLICDHEEIGRSTAEFVPEAMVEPYNLIIELDRAGTDCVTYGLDSQEFKDSLEKFFKVGIGAFSDICSLEGDTCMVNVGIGYHKAHAIDSYLVVKETLEQVRKIIMYVTANRHHKLIQDPHYQDESQLGYYTSYGMKDMYEDRVRCPKCMRWVDVMALGYEEVCPHCTAPLGDELDKLWSGHGTVIGEKKVEEEADPQLCQMCACYYDDDDMRVHHSATGEAYFMCKWCTEDEEEDDVVFG